MIFYALAAFVGCVSALWAAPFARYLLTRARMGVNRPLHYLAALLLGLAGAIAGAWLLERAAAAIGPR